MEYVVGVSGESDSVNSADSVNGAEPLNGAETSHASGQVAISDASDEVHHGGIETGGAQCVFCKIFASDEDDADLLIVWRGKHTVAICNAYPYASGHLMAVPIRHVADLGELSAEESEELWSTVTSAVAALRVAYSPEGVNMGANLGKAAGAGVPGHLHIHALPRWNGDTNFMTSIAEVRVLPEALSASWQRLKTAWPNRNIYGSEASQ